MSASIATRVLLAASSLLLVCPFALCVPTKAADDSRVTLNVDNYDRKCEIDVSQHDSLIHVSWSMGAERRGRLTFDLTPDHPLLQSVAVSKGNGPFRSIAEGTLKIDADPAEQRWLRAEVWDIATNGAFTQPIWLKQP